MQAFGLKALELLLRWVVFPLVLKFAARIIEYWRQKQIEGKTNKEIDDAVDRLEKSVDREEQREALKELVRGIRRRRANGM